MSAKIIYERFLWFHNQVKQGLFPNASMLASHFEFSVKTAQRDIDFMRDRLHAPLEYVPTRRGYRYENDAYQLPGLWLKDDELMSLLVSARLASTVPDSTLKYSLHKILNRILSLHNPSATLSLEVLSRKVSVKNIEYCRTDETVFHQILNALLHARSLTISYYPPHNDEATIRDILPLHLLHYMGTWHLIAHCALKNGLRDFVLSRIRNISLSEFPIACVPAASVKDYIRKNFGIMTGSETIDVCLRFSPAISPWLAEQVWHPAQQTRWKDGKTLCLTFPVADFREVKREILRYGAQVEVVSPQALRKEVMEETEKMKNIYT
jgi:predicted DNA-binding transcriptional regulator YafY